MDVLFQPQPPPCKITLCLRTDTPYSADASSALQDIQKYLMGLGFTLTITEQCEDHFHYELTGVAENHIDVLQDVVQFYAHGHWKIKIIGEEESCQENT